MTRRAQSVRERRRRILQAIVELHAKQGGAATSYAMIARRAKVSIPTVYKFFPTPARMIQACVGSAAQGAPARDLRGLSGPARIEALVKTLFAEHEHYHPWLRWAVGEASVVPGLACELDRANTSRRDFIREALGPRAPKKTVALASALLDYPAWKELILEMRLPPSEARALVTHSIKEAFHGDSNR